MKTQNNQKLEEIFKAIFEIEEVDQIHSIRRLTEPRWDSLAHVSLVAAIESEFSEFFDISDIERMSSYESVKLLLQEKGL